MKFGATTTIINHPRSTRPHYTRLHFPVVAVHPRLLPMSTRQSSSAEHPAPSITEDKSDEELRESFSSALRCKYRGNLRLTTAGRRIRETGIQHMIHSIVSDGWLDTSMPIVTLHEQNDERRLSHENSTSVCFRVLDGNYRVASLQRLILRDKG